jgi:hypothetical protein
MSTRDTHRAGEQIVKSPASQVGKEFQSKQITLSGAAPHTINLEAEGLEPMQDVAYAVAVGGETAARVTVDQSTIATTGFDLLGGADTEVVHLLIHGVTASRVPK